MCNTNVRIDGPVKNWACGTGTVWLAIWLPVQENALGNYFIATTLEVVAICIGLLGCKIKKQTIFESCAYNGHQFQLSRPIDKITNTNDIG